MNIDFTKANLIIIVGRRGSGKTHLADGFKAAGRIPMNLDEGEVPYGLAEVLLGNTAVESGMAAGVDWYRDTLRSSRRGGAAFPCAIAGRMGVAGLTRPLIYEMASIRFLPEMSAGAIVEAADLIINADCIQFDRSLGYYGEADDN